MGTGTVPEAPEFRIQVSEEDGLARVAVEGEIDLATSGELVDAVTEQLGLGSVHLDLAGVSFMDSSGVRSLDELVRAAGEQGSRLTISPELQDQVRQILEITLMLEALPFEDRP